MLCKKFFAAIFVIFTIIIIGGSGCTQKQQDAKQPTNEQVNNAVAQQKNAQSTTQVQTTLTATKAETKKIETAQIQTEQITTQSTKSPEPTPAPKPKPLPMQITSPSFSNNGNIPAEFTCSGSDINPQLNFANIPENAKSLALIMDDPDAPNGTWIHWVVFNINPKTTVINKNSAPSGAIQGANSWGTSKYGGPCPPSGTHRYFFKLYALDNTLSLSSSASKANIESAMQGHILSQATLIGKYAK